MSERLQKVLSRAGYGSRRQIETWIETGRILIDGRLAVLGDKVTGSEEIRLDGRTLECIEGPTQQVLLYHKPIGEIVTRRDAEGRPTIFERLPQPQSGRWVGIGRLDINTSGLLLVTTDGELANALMHPSHEVEREYAVRVFGEVDGLMLDRLLKGVRLEDGMSRFESIQDAGGNGANCWYHVVLKRGRNREVRRLWESQGVSVSRLIRIRYGSICLPPGMAAGRWIELNAGQKNELYQSAGLKSNS